MTRWAAGGLAVVLTGGAAAAWWLLHDDDEGALPQPAPTEAAAPVAGEEVRSVAGLAPPSGRDRLSWLEQPGAAPVRVRGRVVQRGQPVVGATVKLHPHALFPFTSATATTDADGGFDFGEQPAGWVLLTAAKEGSAPAEMSVDIRDPVATTPHDALVIELPGCDTQLEARVLDDLGEHVANARVSVVRGVEGVTNQSGEVSLCAAAGRHELWVEAGDFGPQRFGVELSGRTELEFRLSPATTVRGKVATADGTPVENALVSAFPFPRPGQMMGRISMLGAVSDADGTFELRLAAGGYGVRAQWAAGSTPQRTVTVVAGEQAEPLELVVPTLPTVRGRVVMKGKPVVGAAVRFVVKPEASLNALSQSDGRFVIRGVPAGEGSFTAEPFRVVTPTSFTMNEADGEVEIEVVAQGSIRGVVRRPDGRAISGATVSMQKPLGYSRADAEGRYLLRGVTAGTHALSVHAPDGASLEQSVTTVGDETVELDLTVREAAFVSGTVVDERGASVSGAAVRFTAGDHHVACRADADGAFRCGPFAKGGPHAVSVFPSPAHQFAFESVGPATVEIDAAGAPIEKLALSVKRELLSISGVVVDRGGMPVKGVEVSAGFFGPALGAHGIDAPSTVTDADGAFVLGSLPPGTYTLHASAPSGAAAWSSQHKAGESGVRISIDGPATIEVTVLGFASVPQVSARAKASHSEIRAQLRAGVHVLAVAAGKHEVSAVTAEEAATQLVSVAEGATARVTLRSTGSGRASGTLRELPSGRPVVDAWCEAVSKAGGVDRPTAAEPTRGQPRTDAQGRFSIERVPVGAVRIECHDSHRALTEARVDAIVPSGGRVDVELTMVRRDVPTHEARHGIGLGTLDNRFVIVGRVTPGSPAARAGVRVDDLLLRIDDLDVAKLDLTQAQALLDNHRAGSTAVLEVKQRHEPPRAVRVVLPDSL